MSPAEAALMARAGWHIIYPGSLWAVSTAPRPDVPNGQE